MEEPLKSELSNKRLVVLLVILVVVLLVLVGQWQRGEKNGPKATTTPTGVSKVLTEAERVEVVAQNQALMLQFATATKSSQDQTAMAKQQQKDLELMQLFAPTSPVPSTKEGKENYNLMKLFQ